VTIIALALTAPAFACDTVDVEVEGVDVDVDCGYDDDQDDPPVASVSGGKERDQRLLLQYGMQFLPTTPGHDLSARFVAGGGAYVGGELRYVPASDLLWTARVGAGIDVFADSDLDFTLGLFLGTAGEWDHQADQALLYAAPIAGTEIGLGYDGRKLFGGYRWLGGIGGGPIDDLLTENEITLGYKVTPGIHVLGQYLILSPGEADNQAGVGLGMRVAL
jgi:hypothetical protein